MSSDFNMIEIEQAAGDALKNLQNYNHDQYLSLLLIKNQNARSAMALIYGFNAEITKIPNLVSEPMMGEIRMTWWREVFEGKRAEEAKGNTIAHGLLQVIEHYKLPKEDFANLIEARKFDLYQDPMPSLNDLEGFAGECYSKLLYMSAQILAVENNIELDSDALSALADASGHAGVALCLVDLLARLHRDNKMQRQYIPTALLAAAGTTQAALFAGDKTIENENLLELLIDLTHKHVADAQNSIEKLPKALHPAFRCLALCSYDLKAIEKMGAAIMQSPLKPRPLRRLLKLWWAQ